MSSRMMRAVLATLMIMTGLAISPSAPQAAAAARPNIVWVSCEDISAHLGCYGDKQATTPHIDKLASEGVLYTNAFVAAGVCAPCRSTIITGMYQTTLGTHHMRCNAALPDHIKPFTIAMRDAGYYCTNNAKKDYQFKEPKNTWDESSGKAHWRKRGEGQPFFSVFNFTECHESGIASDSKYEKVTQGVKKHDPATLASFPPYYPDTAAARADWGRYYDVITAMDARVGKVIEQLKDDGLYDDTIVIYWSDHGVGLPRAKRWLYDSGMHVPLVVRFPAKWQHLAPGQPGSKTDRLVSLMDLGPSMLNLIGVKVPAHVQGQPFLGNDLPAERQFVYGARDRMDERYDIIRAVRDTRFKYIRNYEPFKTYYQYMNTPEKGRLMKEIRLADAAGKLPPAAELFLAPTKAPEELYDTEVDPHELNNLADDPAYKQQLERMRAAHMQWVLDTKDIGLMPEPDIADREQALGNRYDILRQDSAGNLMMRLRDAAALSLEGPQSLKQMAKALRDPDAAVRYWGAIGIGNQGMEAKGSIQIIRKALKDKSAVVRVAAARALCRMNEPADALPVLVDVLENGTQWARLHAIIVLDEIDEQARPVLPVMQEARKLIKDRGFVADGKYTVRVANKAVNDLLGTHDTVD